MMLLKAETELSCNTEPLHGASDHTHLVLQQSLWADHLFKDVFSYVSVDGRQRVVQQVDGPVTVHGPGQADPLLLTSGQIHTLNTDKQTFKDCCVMCNGGARTQRTGTDDQSSTFLPC